MNTLENYQFFTKRLAEEFFEYFFEELGVDVERTVSSLSSDWECGDYYFSTDTMEQVLANKKRFTPKIVSLWYDYTLIYDGGYYLSIQAFPFKWEEYCKTTPEPTLQLFTEWYKKQSDENTKYWNSPEGQEETKRQMEELQKKYFPELTK